MNASDWEKVRKNLNTLQNEVDADEIVDYLMQNDVLSTDDHRELNAIPRNDKKISFLLETIKKSPQEKNAFEHFLDALRSTEFFYYCDLADTINGTETKSDSSVKAKVDSIHYADRVRELLNKNLIEKRGKITLLPQIRCVLEENGAFGNTPWSNKELTDFVCHHFTRVEVKEKKELHSRVKTVQFKNLALVDKNVPDSSPQASTGCAVTDQAVNIPCLSASGVKDFLSKELEKDMLSTSSLAEMEKEEITGKILLGMNEDDLKKVMPSSSFGQRREIISIIENYKLKAHAVHKFERFRPFDKEVKQFDSYNQGSFVLTKIETRGKRLIPIRNFHLPQCQSEAETKQFILIHCAIFAASCINERRNGTIYFGIAPDDTGGQRAGEVVGICMSLQDLEECFLQMFFDEQKTVVKSAIRNARYVPVVVDSKHSMMSSETCHVIEFDVVPSSSLEMDEYVKVNAKVIPLLFAKYKTLDPVFVFSDTGNPRLKSPNEMCRNSKIPPGIIEQRRVEEVEKMNVHKPDLLLQLRNHFTGGSNKMEDDIYTFLLLSPIEHATIDLSNLQFIKHIKPEVVFDFDSMGCPNGIYTALQEEQEEILKVVTIDDFDDRHQNRQDMKTFKSELVESSDYVNWVFCNGFQEMKERKAIHWNKKRRHAFQKAFDHYVENCRRDRVLIVICLFSFNEILVEACDEILINLPDQWVLLAETKSHAQSWQEIFKSRNIVDRKDLKDRCIIGLPWEQVNNGVTTWYHLEDKMECQIPHSSGGATKVDRKKTNEWNDIELVSLLDPILPNEDKQCLDKRLKEVEESFYCGGQVNWLNFFSNQVCERKIHEDLFRLVSDALGGRCLQEDNKVLTVYLFHEPGAGGSTSAKEILWSLRKKYRCCIVKKVTNQTIDQLTDMFSFKDKSPKPILILIDNEEEETIFHLRVNLERRARGDFSENNVFCVFLICRRTVFVPMEKRKLLMVTLIQFLDENELFWFAKRYTDLKLRYHDPKSLISFNILKTNFNKEYIQNTVREFVKDITDEYEETILKYVSLINAFDIDFQFIHVSCLDNIMRTTATRSPRAEGHRKTSWEANVSQSFKILLNLSSRNEKRRKTIRVFNKLTAEHILNAITSKTGERESDLIFQLLTDDVFGEDGKEMRRFQRILTNVVKRRAFKEDGIRREKFSPLILSVQKKEGTEIAGKIMEKLYELNDDPYTAQHLSRFYIECKKFTEAEKYAKEAVTNMPGNSHIWDTYTQIFKIQLLERVQNRNLSADGEFTEEEFKELIELTEKCIDLFRKEQSVSEQEAVNSDEEINLAGYFGELESVELIVKAMKKCQCFKAKDAVHRFLVEKNYSNAMLKSLFEEKKEFFKNLWNRSKEAFKKLDDDYLQTKVEIEANPLSSLRDDHKKKLSHLKTFFYEHFGEISDRVPVRFDEEEKCIYRSRLIFSKGASCLSGTLQLKLGGHTDELEKCYEIILQNVQSKFATVDDFKTILDIITVSLALGSIKRGLKFQEILQWSKHLYQESLKNEKKTYLEAYMYFALYNFPTEERLKFLSLAPAQDLTLGLKNWKDSFKSKRKMNRITQRETTLFFLGNGPPLKDIVYQKKLQDITVGKEQKFIWNCPGISSILRPMGGILMPGGDYITFTYKRERVDHSIEIKTSHRITKNIWWRKQIYFYLGFSFSGLKAYGMTDENPLKES